MNAVTPIRRLLVMLFLQGIVTPSGSILRPLVAAELQSIADVSSLSLEELDRPDAATTPGIFSGASEYQARFKDVTDGLSGTIMIGERKGEQFLTGGVFSGIWRAFQTGTYINSTTRSFVDPNAQFSYPPGAGSYHQGGASFAMADGSVVFLTDNTDFVVYNYLGGRADSQSARLP